MFNRMYTMHFKYYYSWSKQIGTNISAHRRRYHRYDLSSGNPWAQTFFLREPPSKMDVFVIPLSAGIYPTCVHFGHEAKFGMMSTLIH